MKIKSKILTLIYEAKDSQYKIYKTLTDNEEIAVVGYFPMLSLDLCYEFDGEYVVHPKFGRQFKAISYKTIVDSSKEGIVSYLSSDIFFGIGEKTALKIYEALGEDTIDKIVKDKSVLKKVKGLSSDKINYIYDTIIKNKSLEKLYIELYNYGLSANMVNKLYNLYEDKVLDKIKENPYRLLHELDGFGFLKSDTLAIKMGFSYKDKRRVKEGIIYTLNNVCNNYGFTYLTKSQLLNSALELLNKNNSGDLIDLNYLEDILDNLDSEYIIHENDRYYIKYNYECECEVARSLLSLLDEKTKEYSLKQINSKIVDFESTYNIKYTLSQKEAIVKSINSNISIITGGPGTGKTTIIKGILNILASLKKLSITDDAFFTNVLLCAPTGRAAKRLGESCMMNATTIHKALGYDFTGEFCYNETNKLSQSIIIIDESSMIDINLASNLLKAISKYAKVIFVGDVDQLPSVGPGNFLDDIIKSEIIPTSHLHEIMRQASDSDIIKISTQIKNRELDYSIFDRKKEVFFYPSDSKDIVNKIILITNNFISKGGNILTDLEILVPMYKGPCGIDAINNAIQENFNKSSNYILYKDLKFMVNDKVLQLKNNPELGIMNGDIGIIKDIYKDETGDYLYIDFDSYMVKYPKIEFDNLTLAYAISIHKSQGMEYKNVIMPVVSSYYIMLKRKLLYTAVSRAKEKLIILGDYRSMITGIKKEDDVRQTTLKYRLNNIKSIKSKKVIYINDSESAFDTLGEEGMDDITPYTFLD